VQRTSSAMKESLQYHRPSSTTLQSLPSASRAVAWATWARRYGPIVTLPRICARSLPFQENSRPQALAKALRSPLSAVLTVDLRDNVIGPRGACALADALEKNSQLTILDLGHAPAFRTFFPLIRSCSNPPSSRTHTWTCTDFRSVTSMQEESPPR
jgi:hypothetical protein